MNNSYTIDMPLQKGTSEHEQYKANYDFDYWIEFGEGTVVWIKNNLISESNDILTEGQANRIIVSICSDVRNSYE